MLNAGLLENFFKRFVNLFGKTFSHLRGILHIIESLNNQFIFTLAGLPLVALDLSDYIHVTDNGVYSVAHMTR